MFAVKVNCPLQDETRRLEVCEGAKKQQGEDNILYNDCSICKKYEAYRKQKLAL